MRFDRVNKNVDTPQKYLKFSRTSGYTSARYTNSEDDDDITVVSHEINEDSGEFKYNRNSKRFN